MQVKIWGARGSIPSPGPHSVRYGGNTPCLSVHDAHGGVLILDAGTGIRSLGGTLDVGPAVIDVLITHAHWDHVQGLPFFAPLYQGGKKVRIFGAGEAAGPVRRVVRDQMSHGTFPVEFESLRATIEIGEMRSGEDVGGFVVEHLAASHQGGAVGFRVREGNGDGAALVYLPDNELGAPEVHGLDPGWRERLLRFVSGAALLVHDAMYTEAEYRAFAGWGHSHMQEAVRMAEEAGVQTLALFHHHPDRSDEALDACLAHCRSAVGSASRMAIVMAAEGETVSV